MLAVAEIAAACLINSPFPRFGRVSSHSQKARSGCSSSQVAISSRSGPVKVAKHSSVMLKGLNSVAPYSAYAKFLRLTSPNLLVTGPAELTAAISPKSKRTFVEVFIV